MIVGIGIDVVDVARFRTSLERTPGLAGRLFTPDELSVARPERLAARFAAKEALAKALGAPPGMRWHDATVRTAANGSPHLELTGTVAAAAKALGAGVWHLSLSHDGGVATAIVILER